MIEPVIKLRRTLEEAMSFKDSPQNNFYMFGGVHLLPNNHNPYYQVTDTPDGIELEDWRVLAKSICGTKSVDITPSFIVEKLTNSDNGDPQLIWSLTTAKNPEADFFGLIYLEITQSFGETFWSTPFMLTENQSERTTQFTYKFKRTDEYQSIGFKTWFRQKQRATDLTTYYETSTGNTVTQTIKVSSTEVYKTDLMSLENLEELIRVIESPYLYADGTRCYLFEAVGLPDVKNQENFGVITYKLSFNHNDKI